MGTVYLICGKICSGKTYYAKQLAKDKNAVILSCDELSKPILSLGLESMHDELLPKIKEYLLKTTQDIVKCGTNVILEWGFWSEKDRKYIAKRLEEYQVSYEWHYIDVSDERFQKNIVSRNETANLPGSTDYYVDEGLLEKCLSQFEIPSEEEMTVWKKVDS